MSEKTICICKRCYDSECEARKALKKLNRRISKKIEKSQAKQLAEYRENFE